MTGCVMLRKDVYYIRLTYYDLKYSQTQKADEVRKTSSAHFISIPHYNDPPHAE